MIIFFSVLFSLLSIVIDYTVRLTSKHPRLSGNGESDVWVIFLVGLGLIKSHL